MKTSTLILLCILLGASFSINAQVNLDSLFAIWNDTSQPDTTRLEAMQEISFGSYKNNPDSSFYFAQLQYDLAEETGHKKYMGLALNTQGRSNIAKANLDESLVFFSKSLALFDEIEDKKNRGRSIHFTGFAHFRKGDLEEGLVHYLQAVKIFSELEDDESLSSILLDLGKLYIMQGSYDKALEAFNQANEIAEDTKDLFIQANAQNATAGIYMYQGDLELAQEIFINNLEVFKKIGNKLAIAGTHSNIGSIYSKQGDLDQALESDLIALEAFEELNSAINIAGVSISIGSVYRQQGNYPEALAYYTKSLNVSLELTHKRGIAKAQYSIAALHAVQANHQKAILIGNQALSIFKELGDQRSINQITQTLMSSYKATGQYKEALDMSELYWETQDSLNSEENQKAIIQTQVQSDYKKQKAIDDLENEKRVAIETQKKENQQKLSIAIGIGLLLISLLALVIFNRLKVTREQKAIIEEQKKKVEQSEKYKEQFLANMSHEIRTPMHAISGMVKILQRNEHPASQDTYLQAMKTSSDNLVVILNDVLDLSKIEAGKLDIESIPLQPAVIMENVSQILKYKAEEKGLALTYQIAEGVPSLVMGDPTRLHQILTNLTSNAIKFTEKGSVDILLKKENGQLKFSIKDTGIGISKNKIENIFGAFEQANDSTNRHYGGTGLGLSISKQLVELQNGKIWVESEEGQGSTFYVELPLVAASVDAIGQNVITEDKLSTMAASLKGIRILLAEDNAFNQMIAQDDLLFYVKDVKIDTVENGALAVEQFQTGNYDLILMDVQMPEMNGFEATRKIREMEKAEGSGKAIPIIAMTASLLKSEIDNCYSSGMDNYIPKPYKPEELIGPIFKALKG